MVCAETSKRRARSSTMTRPVARAMFRISDWRWVRPVTGTSGEERFMVRRFGDWVNAGKAPLQGPYVSYPITVKRSRSRVQHRVLLDKAKRDCKSGLNHRNGGNHEDRSPRTDAACPCAACPCPWIAERGSSFRRLAR